MVYKLLFLFSVIATEISFALEIDDSGGGFKLIAEAIIIFLFLIAILKSLTKGQHINGIFKIWAGALCVIPLFALVMPPKAAGIAYDDMRELLVPFAITYSSYYLLKLNKKDLGIGLIAIGIISAITAIYIITNSGGFDIVSYYREEVNKNQTAPFFATVGLISLAFGLSTGNKRYYFGICLSIFIVCLGYCMILRARTASLVTLFIATYILYKAYRAKLLLIIPILICLIGAFYADQIYDFVQASIIGHANTHDINSLTSGRTERMQQSGEFILSNPLLGALSMNGDSSAIWSGRYPIVHNYLMWKLLKYGLIFASPFLIVYFSIFRSAYKMFRVSWENYKYPIICIFTAFIISVSEYSAPFGPGTSFIICYIIYGCYLRRFYSIERIRNQRPTQLTNRV